MASSYDNNGFLRQPCARGFQRWDQNGTNRPNFRDVLDGTSNTIMMAEIGTSAGNGDVIGDVVQLAADADEVASGPLSGCHSKFADPERPRFYNPKILRIGVTDGNVAGVTPWRGRRWASPMNADSHVFTVLGPNKASCLWQEDWGNGLMTSGSRHPGGAHVLMVDGSVHFVSETIDAGDGNAEMVSNKATVNVIGSPSPYGVWGALGTHNAKEAVGIQDI